MGSTGTTRAADAAAEPDTRPIAGEREHQMATSLPKLRTESPDPRPPGAPGAVWDAFARQAAWKNWALIVLFGLLLLSLLANVRLAARPPEFVVVENPGGKATYVKRAVATDALLKFLADKTRPPEIA